MVTSQGKTRSPGWFHGLGLLLVAGLLSLAPTGCGWSPADDLPNVGALSVNVIPGMVAITVTGPDNYSQSFNGSHFLPDLKPGMYTARASHPVFGKDANEMAVVVGATSQMYLVLHW